MGGWDGLDAARRALADRGIRLMLDFVPNHTAFDHSWIRHHPERYVTATEDDFHRSPSDFRKVDTIHGTTIIACARDPYFPPWTDVAQLNYFNPDTRAAMRATLRTIAEHCDAVRCDMAMLVLNDVFDSTWRRLLRDSWPPLARDFWVEATRDAASIVRDVLAAPAPPPQRLARFIENHDEPRSAAHLSRCVPAAAALVATAPGLRFFFDGQLEGRRIRAPVQLGRWPDEPVDDAIRQMYTRTLQFARAPLLHDGEWRLLHLTGAGDHSFNDIVAYRWRLGEALAVVALNFGGSASQAHVWISDDLPRGREFDFVDARDGARYRWSRESLLTTGLYVRLEAGAAHLFNVDTVDPSV
jgi:alpha amylase-like protein